jgi:hypothetical protein
MRSTSSRTVDAPPWRAPSDFPQSSAPDATSARAWCPRSWRSSSAGVSGPASADLARRAARNALGRRCDSPALAGGHEKQSCRTRPADARIWAEAGEPPHRRGAGWHPRSERSGGGYSRRECERLAIRRCRRYGRHSVFSALLRSPTRVGIDSPPRSGGCPRFTGRALATGPRGHAVRGPACG